jgi:hypothetical protein
MIQLIGNVVFPKEMMAEECVSPDLLFELLDSLAPVAIPYEVAESTAQLVNLIIVNRHSERHLDLHLAIYFLPQFYDYQREATANLGSGVELP